MTAQHDASRLLNFLEPSLSRTQQDARPVVVMTCGIAGAGKSTLSKAIASKHPGFTRLSVDTINHEVHGLYDIDYPAGKHQEYLEISQGRVKDRLKDLLVSRKDAILDLSFWNKEYRDEYKALIEADGGRWVLVFLDAPKDVLWQRISDRRRKRDGLQLAERDGDSAFDISQDTFEMYWSGFERPEGEGEITIKVA